MEVQKRQSCILYSGAQCQGKGKQARTGTQEIASDLRKALLCCVGDRALAQAAQRLWGLLLGDLPELPGCGTLLWVSLLEQGWAR